MIKINNCQVLDRTSMERSEGKKERYMMRSDLESIVTHKDLR